jgi:PadR family transcriptional regulator, regulatory protein PadR
MTMKAVLGEFEHQVLLAVLRCGGEAYSVPIVLELEVRTGRGIAPAAVYIALRRLEEKGLTESSLRTPEGDEGGRSRRYFQVTDEGLAELRASKRRFDSLWEGLEPVLEPGP